MTSPHLMAPEHGSSYYFWAFGSGNEWTPDGTIRGYLTNLNAWYIVSDFGTLPASVVDAPADNFHDAVFLIAGGWNGSADVDTLQVFRYCAPYPGPVSPRVMNNDQETNVTIAGLNFDDSAASDYFLKGPNKARVDFLNLIVVDSKTITATVPAALEGGEYELWVTNGFAQDPTKSRSAALTVETPLPTVEAVDPDHGAQDANVSVTITGNHFFGTPTVRLDAIVGPNIGAANVLVSDLNTLTCDFDLTGAAAGEYDMVVITANGAGIMAGGFTVQGNADDDVTPDDDTATDDDTTPDDDTAADDDTITDDDVTDDDTVDDDAADDDTADDDSGDDDSGDAGGDGCGC